MKSARRQIAEATVQAQRKAAFARVHPPKPEPEPPTDVASLVRAELERQRQAEADAERRAVEELGRGGPCALCGVIDSREVDEDGRVSPAWYTTSDGVLDTWCYETVRSWGAEYALDRAATILHDDGMAGLANPHRLSARVEPGMAQRLSVVAWRDSGAESGVRWGHLAPIERQLRARLEAERLAAESSPSLTFDDLILMPGSEPGPFYGLSDDQIERLTTPTSFTPTEIAKRNERWRKQVEKESRRR